MPNGNSKKPLFYEVGDDGAKSLIDEIVYSAVRDLLREPPDPNFLLDYLWPTARDLRDGEDGIDWGVRLFVDGRGRPDIVRSLSVLDLVAEEIESRRCGDGKIRVCESDRAALGNLAARMGGTAAYLERELLRAEAEVGCGCRACVEGHGGC